MGYLNLFKGAAATKSAFLLAAATLAYAQPVRPLVFVGRSMSPTYGDREVALTLPARGELRRGDVVVVNRPDGQIVKRIALLPGDRVLQVRMPTGWRYAFGMSSVRKERAKRIRYVKVPEGVYFVLGDNLGGSTDSRDFGPVSRASITRKVYLPARPMPNASERLVFASR